jgi:hypothetical protein
MEHGRNTMDIRIEVNGGASTLQAYLEHVRRRFVAVHTAAARYLGLGEGDLRERLSAGDSLGDLADFQGRSVVGLRQAILGTLREGPDEESTHHTSAADDDHPTFLEELVEDLIWVEGGPERLRGRDVA